MAGSAAGRAATGPWPEREPELKKLFDYRNPDGTWLSNAEIARRMRLSKNTISGKLARLGWVRGVGGPPNIVAHREGAPISSTKPKRVKPGESTLPPLSSLSTK
jgi:hypothetical protein